MVPGTSFDDIIALYEFDKKLRLLVLEAVFEVEVYAKAKVCHALGRISPISYENSSLFLNNYCYDEWMIRQEGDIAKNEKNAAVSHYEVQYGKMPIWVASEVWSFGTLVYLYGYLLEKYQSQIAKSLRVGVSEGKHLRSHLKVFNFVRNTADASCYSLECSTT